MVSFLVIDLAFLILFSLFVTWFLRTRKKNLSREGLIFMYRTQAGVRLINYVGDNFKKILDSLKYVIVSVGLFLMAVMIWMLGQTLAIYILRPEITEVIKAPPIAPLIPYFPRLFGLESFFPPFYFTYFIVALAIVAFVHEFSHGIFMRRFGVKIKSTGIVFLGPILGAFVEEEKKGFEKKKNLEQMTILGAGVFANVIFALIFYGLYVLFFLTSFTASGYDFDSYSYHVVPLDLIEDVGIDVGTRTILAGGNFLQVNLTEVQMGNRTFYMNTKSKESISNEENLSNFLVILFDKTPALENNFKGAIVKANDVEIIDQESLGNFLKNTRPGDSIKFTTLYENELTEYTLVLGIHPDQEINSGYIGIAHSNRQPKGVIQNSLIKFMSFKNPSTYYAPIWDNKIIEFTLHLLWWIMIINLLVALFNMLPLGILDGGRFFYLALLSLTGSEKFSSGAFRFMTYAIGFVFLFLMLIWFIRVVL